MHTGEPRKCHHCDRMTLRICDLCLVRDGTLTAICPDHSINYVHHQAPMRGNMNTCSACDAERLVRYVAFNKATYE